MSTDVKRSLTTIPTLTVTESLTASPILLDTPANGGVRIQDGGAEIAQIRDSLNTSGVNLTISATELLMTAVSSGAVSSFKWVAKGTGGHIFDNETDPVKLQVFGAQSGFNNAILDVNANELLEFQGNISAVNQLGIANGTTGFGPELIARGEDTNIDIHITPKGTGALVLNNGTDPVKLRMMGAVAGDNNVISDLNDNEMLALRGATSAVNYLAIRSAATGFGPELIALGDDAAIPIYLTPKGASSVQVQTKFHPPTHTGALQTVAGIYAGSGAPTDANGANGDMYFRSDGGALTTVYQRRAGTWVGIV